MLVTFKTDAYSNVTLFGNIALTLLRIIGHSETVPGAILAADVPAALSRLSKAVASDQSSAPVSLGTNGDDDDDDDDDDQGPAVSLRNRALPLIDLLEAAVASEAGIMWEQGSWP